MFLSFRIGGRPVVIAIFWWPAEWYAGIGTERSKGTKLVSLSGNIVNTGVAEVPFGTTIREIVTDIGGGIPNGKKLKAVHFGGPMGGSIPESLLDTPLDFDELSKLRASISAGSMLVLDEDTSMVDVTRYFLDFLTNESCGKCVPCREGIRQMLKILTNIRDGKEEEASFCILCGLCVRYCAEVKKKNAVGFVECGARREIRFIPEKAATECINCKECFELCPTFYLQASFILTESLALSGDSSPTESR